MRGSDEDRPETLRAQIDRWRADLVRREGGAALADELRDTAAGLAASGLSDDEAFLVAMSRLGVRDDAARDLVHAHAEGLWDRVASGARASDPEAHKRPSGGVGGMLVFAALAGLAVRLPYGAALGASGATPWLSLASMILVPAAVVAAWFWWQRRPSVAVVITTVGALAVFGAATVLSPFPKTSDTRTLALIHLPIALLVVLGASYLGRRWRAAESWQGYVRFLGESLVYYALLALGGGLLLGLGGALLSMVGVPIEFLYRWVLPLGVGGALIVAVWLVETKRGVVGSIAPVVAAVFTPLFALLLVGFLVAVAMTGDTGGSREVLIVVDLVLVVVWALVLFSAASRAEGPPRLGDWLQLGLIASALVVDAVVFVAIAGRVGEYGASPNKLAALGENVVLMASLAWSGWLLVGFLRGRRPVGDVGRWQGWSLAAVGVWAAIVVLVFPVAFGFR